MEVYVHITCFDRFLVTVQNGDQQLVKGQDYLVRYINNVNAGTASVIVTGIGGYTGVQTMDFTIHKAVNDLSFLPAGLQLSPNETYTLVPDGQTIQSISSSNRAVVSISGLILQAKAEGKVQIRVELADANHVSTTAVFDVWVYQPKTRLIQNMLTLSSDPIVYTGQAIRPAFTLKDGDKTLAEGTDYHLSLSNNINAGTATMQIEGLGSYQGTLTKTFTIAKADFPAPDHPAAIVMRKNDTYSWNSNAKLTYTISASGLTITRSTGTSKTVRADKTGSYQIRYSLKNDPNYKDFEGVIQVTLIDTDANLYNGQAPIGNITMHRLYNPNTDEHFYTGDEREYKYNVSLGWQDEGEGWKAPAVSVTPVFRLYNPNDSDHHYTMSTKERDALVKLGWVDEGIKWYSASSDQQPLYRQYNPNQRACNHNYTTSAKEHNYLVSIGWQNEGIAWYGMKE